MQRFTVRSISVIVLVVLLTTTALPGGVQLAYACYTWQVGARVGLKGGSQIRTGSGLAYNVHTTVPNDNWQVDIIGGPRSADGQTWWDVSRANLDGGGTGWVYISQAGYDLCGSNPPPSPGRLILIQDLSVSSSNPSPNQDINGNFRVRNAGGQAITLEYLGIQGRLNGDLNGTSADFNWVQNLTLQPGQEYTYSANRSFGTTGNWRLRPNFRMNGNWSDVHHDNNTINEVWINVQNTVSPGRLILIQDLSVSSSNPNPNQDINGNFRVRNAGGQAITLEYLGLQGRLNGDINGTAGDFNWVQNLTLQPGQEYTYSANRSFGTAGSWRLRPNFRMNGNWSDVHHDDNSLNEVWINVVNVAPPPPAGQLYLAAGLELTADPVHAWPPAVGDRLVGRFTLGNSGGQNLHLEGLGIRLRRNGTDQWDFLYPGGLDLGPGQTYQFDQNNQQPLASGHYRAEITWKLSGQDWQVMNSNEFDVGSTQLPPSAPTGQLALLQDTVVSPVNPSANQLVAGSFTIRNTGSGALSFTRIGIGGRGPWGTDIHDFPWNWYVTLNPGETWTFSGQRSFTTPGPYSFFPVYQTSDGVWHEIFRADGSRSLANLSVQGGAPVGAWQMAVAYQGASNGVLNINGGSVTPQANGYLTLESFTIQNRTVLCQQIRVRVNGQELPLHGRGWAVLMPSQDLPSAPLQNVDANMQIQITLNKQGDNPLAALAVGLCNWAAVVIATSTGEFYKASNTSLDTAYALMDQLDQVASEAGIPLIRIQAVTADLAGGRRIEALQKLIQLNADYPQALETFIRVEFGLTFDQALSASMLGKLVELIKLGKGAKAGGEVLREWAFQQPEEAQATITIQAGSGLATDQLPAASLSPEPATATTAEPGDWAAVLNGGEVQATTGQMANAEQLYLVDGAVATGWSAPTGLPAGSATTVRLAAGRPVDLTSVRIHPGPSAGYSNDAALKAFHLDASLDGVHYQTILSDVFTSGELGSAKTYPMTVMAQYLRLVLDSPQNPSSPVVLAAELEAYGTPGEPSDAQEPDTSPELAPELAATGAAYSYSTNFPGDEDWVRFFAYAGTQYTLATSGLGSDADTVLELYQPDGQTWIATDDDGGPGFDSLLVWTPPESGVYFVKLTQYSASYYGPDYDYQFSLTPLYTPTDYWYGEYYANATLSGAAAMLRQDAQLDFGWLSESPAEGIPVDHFSARWTRTMDLEAGDYTFSVFRDDGVRLWVDDRLLLDRWEWGSEWVNVMARLMPGRHVIRMEMYENDGWAGAVLTYGFVPIYIDYLPSVSR